MDANFPEFAASPEWAPPSSHWVNGPVDAMRAGMATLFDLMPQLVRATPAFGLPPGATIEIELSFSARQIPSG